MGRPVRVAVVAHVFYAHLWPELASCIQAFDNVPHRLFVTLSDVALKAEIQKDFPEAEILIVPNRGYDILPFLRVLTELNLEDYDLVAKLHTKRDCDDWVNGWPIFGTAWRRRLLSFCATVKDLHRALREFERPRVGMVAHGSLIVGKPDRYWESKACFDFAYAELARMGLQVPKKPEFVAGTMFLVRSELLKPVAKSYKPELFGMELNHTTGTAAHSYERLFGYVVKAQGYEIADFAGVKLAYRATEFIRIPVFRIMRWMKRTLVAKNELPRNW